MKMILWLCCALLSLATGSTPTLESVNDDDLVHLIQQETFIVVLFSKKNCEECDKLETHVENLQEDFKSSLSAMAVKAFNSHLTKLYSPTKEPALVFFRHGVPLLYDGPINEDSIIEMFNDNKEPLVKELSDENFEHLTQASTGATTGDWLVMFYTQDCVDCQRLTGVWEAVAAKLRRRLNVARINAGQSGKATGKRFKITKAPVFILIRQGKYYQYEINKYDVKSFVSFAQDWYKNATPQKVSVPESPFDSAVSTGVDILQQLIGFGFSMSQDHPYIVLFTATGFGLTILFAIISKFKSTKTAKKTKKAK